MVRRVRGGVLLLALVVVFAGCVGGDGPDDGGGDADGADPVEDEEDADDPTLDVPLLEDPEQVTLFFTADRGLAPEPPAAGHFTQGEFISDYAQGRFDIEEHVLVSDPRANATLLDQETVTVTVWAESDVPLTPFPGQGETAAAAIFGSTFGMPLTAFDTQDPVFLPGEPTRYEVLLEYGDLRSVVVPKGEAFALFAGLFATTHDASPARILVGGEYASAVTLTLRNMTQDPLEGTTAAVQTFEGTIGSNQDPRARFEVPLGENATALRVEVEHVGGHEADLDLRLLDADGTLVSRSGTPSTSESMYLMGPALDGLRGTTMTVELVHYFAADAAYVVTVTTH